MMVLDDGGFACLQSLQLQLAGATEPESGDKTHSGPNQLRWQPDADWPLAWTPWCGYNNLL